MKQFNLENLLSALTNEDYAVISSGDDIHEHLSEIRDLPEFKDKLPPPSFFAMVKIEGDRLLGVERLMEFIWNIFIRGQMEFDGRELDDDFVVRITQVQR